MLCLRNIARRTLIFVVFLFVHASVFGQIKIVFRFDDYKIHPNKFNDSLIDEFSKNNIPLNLAVIPFDDDSKPFHSDTLQVNRLKRGIKSNLIDIQVHGFNHKRYKKVTTEFSGLSFNDQYLKIQKAKKYLDSLLDIDISTFIPPWNSYDSSTLKALELLKFSCISAGKEGLGIKSEIKYLPFTFEGFSSIPRICEENRNTDAILVIMFHSYDFNGHVSGYTHEKITFVKLDSILQWINKNDFFCYTFSELVKSDSLNYNRFYSNKRFKYGISNYLCDMFKKPLLNPNVYYSTKFLNYIRILNKAIWLTFFTVIFILFYGTVRIAKINKKRVLTTIVIFILILTIFIFFKRHVSIDWLVLSNLSILLAISSIVTLLLSFLKRNQR